MYLVKKTYEDEDPEYELSEREPYYDEYIKVAIIPIKETSLEQLFRG